MQYQSVWIIYTSSNNVYHWAKSVSCYESHGPQGWRGAGDGCHDCQPEGKKLWQLRATKFTNTQFIQTEYYVFRRQRDELQMVASWTRWKFKELVGAHVTRWWLNKVQVVRIWLNKVHRHDRPKGYNYILISNLFSLVVSSAKYLKWTWLY